MAGVLPANVSFFMQRLAGVSSSHFKISPQGATEATSNKIIRFELPSNTLLNFRNIRFFFNAATEGSSAGGRLPNKIDSLIDSNTGIKIFDFLFNLESLSFGLISSISFILTLYFFEIEKRVSFLSTS